MLFRSPEASVVSIGSLKSIREKIARENQTVFNSKPLESDGLAECWKQYIALLKKKKLHSTVTNFNMARLEVLDENCFQVLVANSMQQKFIEAERAGLIEHLMQFFNNRNITYKLLQNETDTDDVAEVKPLSSKERFQLMAEEYPNIKLLKEKIKLELDF